MITKIDKAVKVPAIRLDLIQKFESRLNKLSPPSNPLVNINTPCVSFVGPSDGDGYKIFNAQKIKLGYLISCKAHIASYLLYIGERTDGLQVQHLCGERHCINPSHLNLGTPKQNQEHASKTNAQSKPFQKTWKLSQPDKIQIQKLHYINNYSITLLAEMYEVSTQTISKIVN